MQFLLTNTHKYSLNVKSMEMVAFVFLFNTQWAFVISQFETEIFEKTPTTDP